MSLYGEDYLLGVGKYQIFGYLARCAEHINRGS